MPTTTTVLYCSDPLNERRADAHFAAEVRQLRAGGGTALLIDHDALLAGDAGRAVARVPVGAGAVWYRGWMMPAERYAALDAALRERGSQLVVTPDAYRRAHELPGWYQVFTEFTPESAWLPTAPGEVPGPARLTELAARIPSGGAIVKDYVKSRKHEWAEACHIPDLADEAALHRVVSRFVELQGDDLAGGVVLRAFEHFITPEAAPAETRIWWRDGTPRLITAHPDSRMGEVRLPDLAPVRAAVEALDCPLVTTDLALRSDGVWRVVEVGDGQVSDLHREADRAAFVSLLTADQPPLRVPWASGTTPGMTGFEITGASGADMELIRTWADEEGWNPGDTDRFAFAVADPEGFLVGRLDGEPVACISAVRYGAAFGFIGFYIARPAVRGQGYGIRLWHAAMERLEGRLVGLDGVVEQQDNYRKSGFRSAWNNVRHEGVPQGGDDGGVEIVDAASLPFGQLAAYDRWFFPEPRDAFLSAWTGLPGRTALAAVRDGRIEGLGVIRPCSAASRIGPLYAATPGVAATLLRRLAERAPGGQVAVDVPDANPVATALMVGLGLTPTFEAARMYTGPAPDLDLAGLYGVTSLELG